MALYAPRYSLSFRLLFELLSRRIRLLFLLLLLCANAYVYTYAQADKLEYVCVLPQPRNRKLAAVWEILAEDAQLIDEIFMSRARALFRAAEIVRALSWCVYKRRASFWRSSAAERELISAGERFAFSFCRCCCCLSCKYFCGATLSGTRRSALGLFARLRAGFRGLRGLMFIRLRGSLRGFSRMSLASWCTRAVTFRVFFFARE